MQRRSRPRLAARVALFFGVLGSGAGPLPAAPKGEGRARRREAVRCRLRGDSAGVLRALEGLRTRSQGEVLLRAQALEAVGRPAEALRVLEAARTRGLLVDHVLWARARLQARLGRTRSAARGFRILERSTSSVLADSARLRRADLLLQNRAFLGAALAFRRLRQRYPRYPDPSRFLYGEAAALLLAGRNSAAVPLLRRVMLRYPASPDARRAVRDLTALRRGGLAVAEPTDEERTAQAIRLGRAGQVTRALNALRALGKRPGADRDRLVLGRASVLLANYRYAEAVPLLDRTLKQGGKIARWRARRLLPRALRRAGLLDRLLRRSQRRLKRARTKRAPSTETYWEAARVRLLRGERAEAARLLARSGKARRRSLLAGYLAFRTGKLAQAVGVLTPLLHTVRHSRAARYWLARTRLAQGRRAAALRLLRALARASRLDYYSVLARARLRKLHQRTGPTPAPMVPYAAPRPPHLDDVAVTLAAHRRSTPRLARVSALLRWGLVDRARAELRWVARDHLLASPQSRRARFLRPISRGEAYRGVRHRARPRSAPAEAVAPRRAPGAGFDRALYRAFVRLDDPYMANRFAQKGTDHPHRGVQRPHERLVRQEARLAGIPAGWVWAIMTVESAYCNEVVSQAGALGLLQIMPLTARRIAGALGERGLRLERLFRPSVNIRFGVWYLGRLVQKFGGQLALAAAAYNGGPHNVEHWLKTKAAHLELDEFVEEIPLRETRRYVKRVVGLAARYAVLLGEPWLELVRLRIDPQLRNVIDF